MAYEKYQENRTRLLDWNAADERVKDEAKQNFTDTDYALKQYGGNQDPHLREPRLSDFYKPSTSLKQGKVSSLSNIVKR